MKPVKSFHSEVRNQEKLRIENSIKEKVIELKLDTDVFSDYLSIIDNIDDWLNIPLDKDSDRFNYRFTVYTTGGDSSEPLDAQDVLEVMSNSRVIYRDESALIIVDQVISSFPYKEITNHPFCSPSLHELFKLLAEWQWCFYNLSGDDSTSTIANKILTSIGLDVRKAGSDSVIDSIMSLPDQQVASFLKGGISEIPEKSTKCPIALRAFFLENGMLKITDNEISKLVYMCLRRMRLQRR